MESYLNKIEKQIIKNKINIQEEDAFQMSNNC